jgi:hypothetical protein
VPEAYDFAAGEMLVGELPGTLKNHVESALQITIENFFFWQFAVHQVGRHPLGNWLFPNAARGVMAGVCESQHFKALGCQHTRETGSSIRRKIHNFFAAGAAVKKNKSAPCIGFFVRRENGAMHIPIVAVAVVTSDGLGGGELALRVRLWEREPVVPREFDQQFPGLQSVEVFFRDCGTGHLWFLQL